MRIYKTGIFAASNQGWKLIVFVALLIVQLMSLLSVLGLDGGYLSSATGIEQNDISNFGLLHACCILLPWFALALRCPNCKKRPIWFVLRHLDQKDIVGHLESAIYEKCPSCSNSYSKLTHKENS